MEETVIESANGETEERKTKRISKKKGYYMDRPATESIYSVGPDYEGGLFPKDTEIVQEIVFRRGRNRVKTVKPEKDSVLSDYDLRRMQKEDELVTKKRGENKYIKQIIRGSTETHKLNYVTKAIVNNRYEKVDVRYELGLYPEPYLALLRALKSLRNRLYG